MDGTEKQSLEGAADASVVWIKEEPIPLEDEDVPEKDSEEVGVKSEEDQQSWGAGVKEETELIIESQATSPSSADEKFLEHEGTPKEETNASESSAPSETYTCMYCDFQTTLLEELNRHIAHRHHSELTSAGTRSGSAQSINKPYKCPHCDFRTIQTSTLKHHVAAHSDARPMACPHCDYLAVMESNLKNHILTKHKNAMRFRCTHCDYGTMNSTRLRNHVMAKHTKQKPLSCPHCDYSTIQTSNLKNHITARHSNIRAS